MNAILGGPADVGTAEKVLGADALLAHVYGYETLHLRSECCSALCRREQ